MTTAPERSTVYALESASGWPRTWEDFNTGGFVNPATPGVPDMRYYYRRIGERAQRMGVDGIIISTPDINQPRRPDPVSHWRIRMEGRIDALDEGFGYISDRSAIIDGMVLLRQRVPKIVLYTGFPNDVSPRDTPETDGTWRTALSEDPALCEGYVRASLGPWLDSGMVDCIIVDSSGDYWPRFVCRAVCAAIRRLYPRIRLGCEGHGINFNGHPFSCSLTTFTSRNILEQPWRIPVTPTFWPQFVAFTEPHSFVPGGRNYHPSRYDDAILQLRRGRSIAVQPWTVGMDIDPPADENRAAWEAFMLSARAIQGGQSAAA